MRAAALNHHDVWTLRGVGVRAERLPMILGSDAAGVDADGHEVIVHAVIARGDGHGDETLDPRRSAALGAHPGTLAEHVAVPRGNLVPKPQALSFEEAACLPTAWLTAYRMLFVGGVPPGQTVLVQGAGGGVATAPPSLLAPRAGLRVWVTSRAEAEARAGGRRSGRTRPSRPAPLPERVDVVLETVGKATWTHSVRSVRPGGTWSSPGATSGGAPAGRAPRGSSSSTGWWARRWGPATSCAAGALWPRPGSAADRLAFAARRRPGRHRGDGGGVSARSSSPSDPVPTGPRRVGPDTGSGQPATER